MDITLLTRDPQHGGNNWVVAVQDEDNRLLVWGKGFLNARGQSLVKVDEDFDDDLDTYIAKRVNRNYVEQVRVKVYFPTHLIRKFVAKHLPKILKVVNEVWKAAGNEQSLPFMNL